MSLFRNSDEQTSWLCRCDPVLWTGCQISGNKLISACSERAASLTGWTVTLCYDALKRDSQLPPFFWAYEGVRGQ